MHLVLCHGCSKRHDCYFFGVSAHCDRQGRQITVASLQKGNLVCFSHQAASSKLLNACRITNTGGEVYFISLAPGLFKHKPNDFVMRKYLIK